MRKSIYNLAAVTGAALLVLSCNNNEFEFQPSLVKLSLDVVSDVSSPDTRSSETVFEHQLTEDLWLSASVSDNPVSPDAIPTRGTITTTGSFVSLYGSNGFAVYAEEKNTPANVLFNNEVFVYSSQDMTWAPSGLQKWPLFATEWYCWAPAGTATLSNTDKTFTYSTPSTNGASGEDILVSHVSSVPAKRTAPLAIAFDHALCAVKFKSNLNMSAGTVTALSINGINMDGTYDFTTDSWSNQSNPGSISLVTSVTVSGTVDTLLTSDSQIFFVMPQTVGSGASVSLTFNGQSHTISLPSGFEFRAGEIITFTLGPSDADLDIKAFPLDENFGSVSVSSAGPFKVGDTITLRATPKPGCHLAYWVDENGQVYKDSYGTPFTTNTLMRKVSGNDTYLAVFETNSGVDFCVGSFTVSANPKVVTFSPGNLWASVDDEFGTVTSWHFESAQQYNRHFNGVLNDISRLYYNTDQTPSGTVGSFFWTGDYQRASAKNFDDSDWTPYQTFFAFNGAIKPKWSVLSKDEWDYLLNTRPVQGGSGKNYSFRQVRVAGMNGLLLYPDGYNKGTVITDLDNNWYPIDFIPEGCVFLSLAGVRSTQDSKGVSYYGNNGYGMYWTSTPEVTSYVANPSIKSAYMLNIKDYSVNVEYQNLASTAPTHWVHDARSIRMVHQTYPPLTNDNPSIDNNVTVTDPDYVTVNGNNFEWK